MKFLLKNLLSIILGLMTVVTLNIDGWNVRNADLKVDSGGHKLSMHMEDAREKSTQENEQFTILFENGYGDTYDIWKSVQPEVAKKYKTISYSRAGLGESEDTANEKTSLNQVKQLHKMLENSNQEGPYIIVAHSIGGYNARLFAKEYPDEVAGIVFVDSSHEDQDKELMKFMTDEIKEMYMGQFTSEGDYQAVQKSADQVRESRESIRNIPITVLTAGNHGMPEESEVVWKRLQNDILSLSNNSKQTILDNGHYIHTEAPDVVVDAIVKLVDRIR